MSLACNYNETDSQNKNWSISADATLKWISFNDTVQSIQKDIPKTKYKKDCRVSKTEYITLENNLDVTNDGHFQFGAMIKTSPLFVMECQSSGNEITSTQFGMVIRNIKENFVKQESQKFNLRGINWYFRFKKLDGFLGIFLHSVWNHENCGWSFEVDYTVRLLSNKNIASPKVRRTQQRFDYDFNNWGYNNFIKWDDLLDKEYTYVFDHAFFEISIDVKPGVPIWKIGKDLLEENSKSKCSICLDEFTAGVDRTVLSTACGHLFCGDCIRDSIRKNAKCPLCNADAKEGDLRVTYSFS